MLGKKRTPGDDPGACLHHFYITATGYGSGDASESMSPIAWAVRLADAS